jgi:rubredoxin
VPVIIGLVSFIAFGACAYMISATIKAKGEPKKPEVIMIKIITTHLQICAMASAFPLAWPSVIRSMFTAMNTVSSVSGETMSVDCEMGGAGTKFYEQSIALAIAPILITCGCTLFWGVVWLLRHLRLCLHMGSAAAATDKDEHSEEADRMKENLHPGRLFDRWVVSLVVLLFLVHPTLTKTATQLWACSIEDMEGLSFLEQDFTKLCYTPEHAVYALGVGLLMFIAYVVGIPLLAYIILRIKHTKLMRMEADARGFSADDKGLQAYLSFSEEDRMDIDKCPIKDVKKFEAAIEKRKGDREMFGFLYSGYEDDYYYWEIIIMFRKVAFGIISVLIKPYGVDIQTYCGILVLITAFIYNATARPFLNDDLDDLENGALFTSFLTLYGGLYLFSDNSSAGLKIFCTLGIIVLNIGFAAFVIKTTIRLKVEEWQQNVYDQKTYCPIRDTVKLRKSKLPNHKKFRGKEYRKKNGGVPFEELPDDWKCPASLGYPAVPKSDYHPTHMHKGVMLYVHEKDHNPDKMKGAKAFFVKKFGRGMSARRKSTMQKQKSRGQLLYEMQQKDNEKTEDKDEMSIEMTDMEKDPSVSIPVVVGTPVTDKDVAELSAVDNTLQTITLDKTEEKEDDGSAEASEGNDSLAATPLKPPAMTMADEETASPSAVVASEIEDKKEVEI